MDRQRTNRTYHSSAVLLPDGRVLSAGANTGEPEETTVEFFSPPYLFRGKRPRIRSVSRDSLRWGGSFTVRTDEARAIESVVLMKPGANTHQMNFDQRSVPLVFDASRSVLAVDLPSPRIANPPGYYMLFILNGRGVPSVAEFVHVSIARRPQATPAERPLRRSGALSVWVSIAGARVSAPCRR